MASSYVKTVLFPEAIACRVGDLIPAWCRSATMHHYEDIGSASITAHRTEIAAVRRAINQAYAEARLREIETAARNRLAA